MASVLIRSVSEGESAEMVAEGKPHPWLNNEWQMPRSSLALDSPIEDGRVVRVGQIAGDGRGGLGALQFRGSAGLGTLALHRLVSFPCCIFADCIFTDCIFAISGFARVGVGIYAEIALPLCDPNEERPRGWIVAFQRRTSSRVVANRHLVEVAFEPSIVADERGDTSKIPIGEASGDELALRRTLNKNSVAGLTVASASRAAIYQDRHDPMVKRRSSRFAYRIGTRSGDVIYVTRG
jgi:hypothetical protein